MARAATPIALPPAELALLQRWVEEAPSYLRRAERARIILLAAAGHPTGDIARLLDTRPARVSKWRTRYARLGPDGLQDAHRSGKPPSHGAPAEQLLLSLAASPPPSGRRRWTLALLAAQVPGLSPAQARRILHRHGLHLASAAPAPSPLRVELLALLPNRQVLAIRSGAPAAGRRALLDALLAPAPPPPLDLDTALLELAASGPVHIFDSSPPPEAVPARLLLHPIPGASCWLRLAAGWLSVLLPLRNPNSADAGRAWLDILTSALHRAPCLWRAARHPSRQRTADAEPANPHAFASSQL